ncbi:MAG: serine protease [Alphaproteobacteria bacterium]|nr:serine protease [Alphaproteobacteria bacterium]
MTRHIRFACMGLALLVFAPNALLQAAEPPGPGAMPEAGKAGVFAGPKSTITGWKGISPKAAGAALMGLRADTTTVRGGAESAIYRKIAPSVVLVVTDKGLGSGSLISEDGQILTNYHVIAGFDQVNVILKPEKEGDKLTPAQAIAADVIKVDPATDLALLKMRTAPPTDRIPVTFGDFAKVTVGDDVNAIGHPEGEVWTFTKGYVSQIRRDYKWKVDGIEHQADVIQTQTPINPGNSGGPLLDSKGALIGVNSFVSTEGQNLSYAVGVDVVQAFIKNPARVTVAAATAEAAKPKCEPHLVFEGRTKENDGSVRRYDMFCHGRVDLAILLPDDTKQPMVAFIDTVGSGKPDGQILSYHRDGHWDISYWDSKHTGHWDMIGYHPDGKLKPTSFGPYIPEKGAPSAANSENSGK